MSLKKKPDYIKLKKYYKGYFIEEFDEDYFNYRAVVRLINSYFKNPHHKKTHDIYNRLVILHRVFDKKFINIELINTCDDDFKKSYLKFILNEMLMERGRRYDIEYLEEEWENDVDILKKSDIICRC